MKSAIVSGVASALTSCFAKYIIRSHRHSVGNRATPTSGVAEAYSGATRRARQQIAHGRGLFRPNRAIHVVHIAQDHSHDLPRYIGIAVVADRQCSGLVDRVLLSHSPD